MSNEANTTPNTTTAPSSELPPDAQAGEMLSELMWGKEEPEAKEPEAKEPEPKGESEAKGDETKGDEAKEGEEPEAKEGEGEDEDIPLAVQFKIARQRRKAVEKKEKEVTAFAEQVRSAAEQVTQKERMVLGIIEKMPQDIGNAWDSFAKMAGLDPKHAWEALVRAKVNGEKKPLTKAEVSPEISSLKEMVNKLAQKLEEKETSQSAQAVSQQLQQHHVETLNFIITGKEAYPHASMLSEEDLNAQIQGCILRGYQERQKGNKDYDFSRPAIARRVDKWAKLQYDKWNRGAPGQTGDTAGTSKPAESPAKAPLKGSRKPSLSAADAAESSGSKRELTESERMAEAGDTLQRLLGI